MSSLVSVTVFYPYLCASDFDLSVLGIHRCLFTKMENKRHWCIK
jgi:hypothetical protein